MRMTMRSWVWSLLLAGFAGSSPSALLSQVPASAAKSPAQAASSAASLGSRPLAFDVVSIRENTMPPQLGTSPQFGPTPDGYRAINMPLIIAIITAYAPSIGTAGAFIPNQVSGLPDWAQSTRYDIVAKVADDDLARWQNPAEQPAMLRAMLEQMLVDRCHIKAHRDVKEKPIYSLVSSKGGPKFQAADPNAEHPAGIKLPWGGELVPEDHGFHLYGATMASLATLMSNFSQDRPVVDNTGLAGKYDIVAKLPQIEVGMAQPQSGERTTMASEPSETLASTIATSLGLELKPAKSQVETLVIDHLEKPSDN